MFLTESSSPNSIADLGGIKNSTGNITLFSAYKTSPGPWTNVVYYTKQTSTVTNSFSDTDNSISVFPNPFSQSVTVQTDRYFHNAVIQLKNIHGQTVIRKQNITGTSFTIQREYLPKGIYFLCLTDIHEKTAIKKVVVID